MGIDYELIGKSIRARRRELRLIAGDFLFMVNYIQKKEMVG